MPQQRKFFPGWLVVTSGFVIMATCYTIFVNCMSLFQPLIVSDLGISLAQYNISNAISTVVSVVGSLVIGHVADKVSGRVLGSLTVIATSAVLAGMSFVGELWQVYVLFAVSGCFAVASTRLLISLVTANWFTAKRGLAISIALSGSGFGGAILSPIVSSLIVSVGWRSAFLVLAAVCIVAALPITAYSFRTKPSEIGLKPLGENPGDPSVSTAGDKDEHTAPEVSVGWSRIKKSPAFWLLVVAFLFMGLVNGAILPNQVTNMTSVTVNGAKIVTGGHDPLWAGTVLSAYMVTVVIAKISLGAIYDRFGLRFGNILGSVACIIACVALCFPTTDLGPIVAAVSFGIGTCMGTITPTIAASSSLAWPTLVRSREPSPRSRWSAAPWAPSSRACCSMPRAPLRAPGLCAWRAPWSCSYSCWPRSPSPPSCAQAWRGSRRPSLFSVRSVLSVAALEAEWMLVPSFGFQGGHGPTK